MQTLDIGFIGLGVMGAPMAGHLAHGGHRLRLHDADAAVATALAHQRAAALVAGPGASVSELARWVEQQSQVPVTRGAQAC